MKKDIDSFFNSSELGNHSVSELRKSKSGVSDAALLKS